jgi:hypothetical protein
MKTKIEKVLRISALLLICSLLFFCKESLKVDQQDQAGLKNATTTAIVKTLPSNDGPGNPWTMNGISRIVSPKTGLQLKSATVTGTDNENNAGDGVPDGDMDVYLFRVDPQTPIEFNIFVAETTITSAQLSLLCWDVDWATNADANTNERDEVFFNGHSLGFLTGANGEWSTSIFNVDPSWVIPGPAGKNLVKIDIDVLTETEWAVEINWGQLVINGTTPQTAEYRSVTIPKAEYTAGETVVATEEADATPNLLVRSETNLLDPDGNIIAGIDRELTATSGDEPFAESLVLPASALPGNYKVRAILYDAASNQQLDLVDVPFTVGVICVNPTSGGVIGNAQTICEGGDPQAITSTAPAAGSTGTLEYKWQSSTDGTIFTDIAASNMDSFDPTALGKTTLYKRLARVDCMADWSGAAASNVIEITVNPLPEVEAGADASIYLGYAGTQLNALANPAGGTFLWSPPDGLTSADIANPVAKPLTTTTYTVKYTNTNGCAASDNVKVTVLDPVAVPLDIKPGACPNPFNRYEKGVLPVAVLGYSGLKVADIDPASLRLAGVEPIRWSFEDVATPYLPFVNKPVNKMSCNLTGKDGNLDLTVKFDATRFLTILSGYKINNLVTLKLTGKLKNGTPIRGEDVILIVK